MDAKTCYGRNRSRAQILGQALNRFAPRLAYPAPAVPDEPGLSAIELGIDLLGGVAASVTIKGNNGTQLTVEIPVLISSQVSGAVPVAVPLQLNWKNGYDQRLLARARAKT